MRIRLSAIVFFCALCSIASAQEYVDLGLSVKWSSSNTGITADRPVGWYYRWPDAMAIVTTDGSRMGTKAEWDELREYCTWKWTEQNGIGGYLVTSKIKGYTDRSIFLPAAGWLQDGQLMEVGTYASYWCSTPGVQPDDEAAYGFNFKRGADEWHSENRESEQSVRMVMPLSGKEVSGIKLEKTRLTLQQGAGTRLKVTMGKREVNSACTWKSSDENVIKVVEDGLLVAAGPGSCKVQVTAYGKTAQCTVTVTPHEFEYVDLGLSVLWANANLGASAPESYGDYYAWAEIEPKESFSWGNYRYSSFPQRQDGMDKYTTQGQSHQYLKADNLNRLEPTDDAATVMLGDGWRIPTNDEIVELVKNCTYDAVTVNGTHGIRFTSNVPGFDGHSIFIPYSGQMNGNEPIDRGKQFSLWTSIPGSGTRGSCFSTIGSVNGMRGGLSELPPIEVLRMAFDFMFNGYESRFMGMNIRPVRSLTDDMFTSLSLPAERIDISYGAIRNVEAVMMPSGRQVKPTSINWSSSAPQIVSIDENGFLTAVGQGTCVITAETEGRKAQMTVNVSLPVPEAVDLGLSVMWASANLGASRPDEAGGYFAWGETSPKPGLYSGENYKFGQYTNEMTKYNFYTSPGPWGSKYPLDYKETLDPEDDAAAVLLGNGWRMPTADELWELKNRCTWEAKYAQDTIEYNHDGTVELYFERRLLGYVITSNVPGYEDRSIWLPAAGYISNYNHDSNPVSGGSANYWTSTLGQSLDNGDTRWNGKSIRPVMELPQQENRPKAGPDPVKPLRHNAQVDLGLSVLWADCNVGADSPQETGARFAWGETAPKIYYSEYNYKYMKAFKDQNKWWYSKYTTTDEDPYVDGLTRLSAEDDAARANWGGKWRMPTKEEYKELYEKCEWTLDSVNGVKGYRITSKVPGYTDKSIFLPNNSNSFDRLFDYDYERGIYMTSDKKSSEKSYSWRGCVVLEFDEYEFGTTDEVELDFGENATSLLGSRMSKIHITSRGRTNGCCVRAVCEK